MAAMNIMMPVVAGKEDELRAFATELLGSRREQFVQRQIVGRTERETWTLVSTANGPVLLVYFAGHDLELSHRDVTEAQDEFAVWSRRRLAELTGVDIASDHRFAPTAGPEVILDWKPNHSSPEAP
jgi:hypothetical protein